MFVLRVRPRLRNFQSCEKGSMTILAVIFSAMAMLICGLAVDVMRFENRRTQMQNVLDLCVLNAASLRQTLDEKTVFDDCVLKARITGTITRFQVIKGTTSKAVSASAAETLNTMFIGMLGMNTLTVEARASAAERVSTVEVVLVLDVSTSMDGPRITNLKAAAKEFVRTLMSDDPFGRVLITVVPYSGKVNLGQQLGAKYTLVGAPFNTTNTPDVRSIRCVDLPDASFAGTAISRTTPLQATAVFDVQGAFALTNTYLAPTDPEAQVVPSNMPCQPTQSPYAGNAVRLPNFTPPGQQSTVDTAEKRVAALSDYIDSLTPNGTTSINLGMRWGLAFLDPSMNSIYREFIATGQMPASAINRPVALNDPDVMKVIVLMSDGENTADVYVNRPYSSGSPLPTATTNERSPMSPIWQGTDGNYSIFHTGRPDATDHYVPHLGSWRATPWVNATDTGTATNLTWGQVNERMRLSYVSWQLYARPGISNTTAVRNMVRTSIPATTMDSQLQTVYNTARGNNVLVYSIAFQATANGVTVLRNCATTASRFYSATPTTISQVFASIAGNISKLRLTQ